MIDRKLIDQDGRQWRLRRRDGETDDEYEARAARAMPMRFEDFRDLDRNYELVDPRQRAEYWARMQREARQRIRSAVDAEAVYLDDFNAEFESLKASFQRLGKGEWTEDRDIAVWRSLVGDSIGFGSVEQLRRLLIAVRVCDE